MASLRSPKPVITCLKTHWLMGYTGPDVPIKAISYRFQTLRKEAVAAGISISDDNSPPVRSFQVKRTANSSSKQNSNGRKRKTPMSDDSE